MTSNIDFISNDATAEGTAVKMKNLNVGAIPVCEEERLCGMVTDRDLELRVMAEGLDPKKIHVGQATSSEVLFCYEHDGIEKASRVMSQRQIRRLPILSRANKLVGIVSLGDLAIRGKDARTSADVLENVFSQTSCFKAGRGAGWFPYEFPHHLYKSRLHLTDSTSSPSLSR